jgi:hypothetical protein
MTDIQLNVAPDRMQQLERRLTSAIVSGPKQDSNGAHTQHSNGASVVVAGGSTTAASSSFGVTTVMVPAAKPATAPSTATLKSNAGVQTATSNAFHAIDLVRPAAVAATEPADDSESVRGVDYVIVSVVTRV